MSERKGLKKLLSPEWVRNLLSCFRLTAQVVELAQDLLDGEPQNKDTQRTENVAREASRRNSV